MLRSRYSALSLAAALLFFSACKDEPTGPENFTVSLSALNLQRLPAGQGHYELWISFPEEGANRALAKPTHGDEAFVSFGKFNLSADNSQLLNLGGQPMTFTPAKEIDINLAVDALITMELEGDNDEAPGSRLLGGDFTGSDATANAYLATSAEDVFNFDFRTVSAAYVLTTPTTSDTTDFKQGIWWITRGNVIASGFDKLPVLADTSGWRYEGWLVDRSNSAAYSTGKFRSANLADDDRAGITAGTNGDGFTFPGQDFIRAQGSIPALLQLDNGNFEARITLEPEPDNASTPSYLVLLNDEIIGPNLPSTHTPQAMNNRATGLPSATVTIKR